RAPQYEHRLGFAHLVVDLQSEIAPLDQLVVEPHRIAVTLQHGGKMLRRPPALALVGDENLGHARRQSLKKQPNREVICGIVAVQVPNGRGSCSWSTTPKR